MSDQMETPQFSDLPENGEEDSTYSLAELLTVKTIDGLLTWTAQYEGSMFSGGYKERSKPNAYIMTEAPDCFGRVAVVIESEKMEVHEPVIVHNGEIQDSGSQQIHTLLQTIEEKRKEMMHGEQISTEEKIQQAVQQQTYRLRKQLDQKEAIIHQKDNRIDQLLSTLDNVAKYANYNPEKTDCYND